VSCIIYIFYFPHDQRPILKPATGTTSNYSNEYVSNLINSTSMFYGSNVSVGVCIGGVECKIVFTWCFDSMFLVIWCEKRGHFPAVHMINDQPFQPFSWVPLNASDLRLQEGLCNPHVFKLKARLHWRGAGVPIWDRGTLPSRVEGTVVLQAKFKHGRGTLPSRVKRYSER